VTILGEINGSSNNVTGAPQNGTAFNGVIFQPPFQDEFVSARATAINNGVPGAILADMLQDTDPQSAFGDAQGFVDAASSIYTQHLALVAKNTYFLSQTQIVPANTTSLLPRLVVAPVAAYALSVLLIVIGVIGLAIGICHHIYRKGVYLASPPGSIASAISMTSHSGFGELLVPYDTEETMTYKLDGLAFRLDPRTGAVVAYDRDGDKIVERKRKSYLKRGISATSTIAETKTTLLSSEGSPTRTMSASGYVVEPFTPPPPGVEKET